MSALWGKGPIEKKEGFFVDLCPVCRRFTPYQLYRISKPRPLLGLRRREGELRGYEGMCQECETRVDVDPTDYRSFYEVPGNSISNLIRDTFPSIRKARARRLKLEMSVREGSLREDDRRTLMMEPFQILEESTRRIFRRPFRWLSVALMALLTLCVVTLGWGASRGLIRLSDQQRQLLAPSSPAMAVCVAGFVTAWVGAIYLLAASRSPFHRKVVPTLITALRPLRPSRNELGDCLEQMRRSGSVIGKKLKLATLWKELQ